MWLYYSLLYLLRVALIVMKNKTKCVLKLFLNDYNMMVGAWRLNIHEFNIVSSASGVSLQTRCFLLHWCLIALRDYEVDGWSVIKETIWLIVMSSTTTEFRSGISIKGTLNLRQKNNNKKYNIVVFDLRLT